MSDTTSELWIAAAERVRQHAPEGTPAVVVRRAIELEYARTLDEAATDLIARISQTEESSHE